MSKDRLFDEFSPITGEEWKKQIIKDLKGADYDEKLLWNSDEGFPVQPYYTGEDLKGLSWLTGQMPGSYPFARSGKKLSNSWNINIEIGRLSKDISPDTLNTVLDGADSVTLDFTVQDLSWLAGRLPLNEIDVNIKAGPDPIETFTSFIKEAGEAEGLSGGLYFNSSDFNNKKLLEIITHVHSVAPEYRSLLVNSEAEDVNITSEVAYQIISSKCSFLCTTAVFVLSLK